VQRSDIAEVDERIAHDGEVLTPIDMDGADAAIDRLVAAGVESIAVSLLHAYANPAHEQALAEHIAARAPGVAISLSCEVSPKYREYERTSTTVANAYIKPIVARYIGGLQELFAAQGIGAALYVMQSNGGLITPELASKYPIRIVESGPSAGVLLCGQVGRAEGCDHLLTFDMGGTTAKLGAMEGGEPAITSTFEVDGINFRRYSGLPLNIPAIELIEIGAGGGSIAATSMGLIRVGPESAGADPGPVCYGRGGTRATLTDANVALGYINPDNFAGGSMRIDRPAAERAVAEQIGAPLSLRTVQAAWGIHAVANANMERAMRSMSMDRGRDPRRYALVAFGGAGPLHAAQLARALGVPTVIVPWGAGVGSAIGLLTAEQQFNVSLTRILPVSAESGSAVAAIYRELEARVRGEVAGLHAGAAVRWKRYAYLRYAGQGYEIKVDLPAGDLHADVAARLVERFHETYRGLYGYSQPEGRIEAADWYLTAVLPAGAAAPQAAAAGPLQEAAPAVQAAVAAGAAATAVERPAYFGEFGRAVPCRVVDRYALAPGARVRGPAIIEEAESTTVILPGDEARVSPARHLIITIGGQA
jgi:N-methylhydantoinase A/oxoprolinase/acetone carboxylase beta subunit